MSRSLTLKNTARHRLSIWCHPYVLVASCGWPYCIYLSPSITHQGFWILHDYKAKVPQLSPKQLIMKLSTTLDSMLPGKYAI